MPMSFPWASTKGPPENPGFSLASVAMMFSMAIPRNPRIVASGVVMIPVVAVGCLRLKGFASAIMNWPVFRVELSPNSIGRKSSELTFRRAISLKTSTPTTLASMVFSP